MKRGLFFISCLVLTVLVPVVIPAHGEQEESEDYYAKWLKEDVVYIIAPEEKSVFESLTTSEEKDQFIELFWHRRDPDLRTAINEFKEEHYRRIVYANERFTSGFPGWRTDRGRVYIIHGEPDRLESNPSGGTYDRPFSEGGGITSVFPFEKWWYRHIEGLGEVEVEFVDRSFSGEYRLARRPEEKDAFLHVPGAGLTIVEELGLATKRDRPIFTGASNYPYIVRGQNDNPFRRYETYALIQRPAQIKYEDLQEIVKVDITFSDLPFKIRQDYFKLNEDQVLVPITLEFQNKELTFKTEGDVHVARIAIYGIITSITNRVITEFEDDVSISYQPQQLGQGLQRRSLYQKIIPLDRKMRYKVDLVVKDLNSEKVGVIRQAIIPPVYHEDRVSISSMILSQLILSVPEAPEQEEMFVLGDVKILPSLGKTFVREAPLAVYLQVYNVALDQTSLAPSLRVSYKLLRQGERVMEVVDESGEPVYYFSQQRVVLIRSLPIDNLGPGEYRIEVEIQDRIKNQVVAAADNFQVVSRSKLAQR